MLSTWPNRSQIAWKCKPPRCLNTEVVRHGMRKKNTLQLQSKCYRCKLEKLNSDILHICKINNKCLVGNQGMPSIISTWLHGTFENLSHIHMKNVLMKCWLVFSHAKHSRSVGTHFHLHSWTTSSDPRESIAQLIHTKRRRSSTNSSCALCII